MPESNCNISIPRQTTLKGNFEIKEISNLMKSMMSYTIIV